LTWQASLKYSKTCKTSSVYVCSSLRDVSITMAPLSPPTYTAETKQRRNNFHAKQFKFSCAATETTHTV